jgi:hypothetical protein
MFFALPLSAQVYLTRDQALELYFPGARAEKQTLFLNDDQIQAIQQTARSKVPSKIVTYFTCKMDGRVAGYAFFDAEVIRTQKAAYMIALDAEGKVRALEILAFYEPEDYRPPKRWTQQFDRKTLQDDLWIKRGIPNISGATLSAQVLTDAVRRTLAIYAISIHKD